MNELQKFVLQVSSMRTAQCLYFQKIGTAKKTKLPGDWAGAATALKLSKELEASVDKAIAELNSISNTIVS